MGCHRACHSNRSIAIPPRKHVAEGSPPVNQQISLPFAVSRRNVLENFFPGSNAELLGVIRELTAASRPGLLYIHGAAGSGKSHLLQGAVARARALGKVSAYIPVAELGVRVGLLDHLNAGGVLCLDDLHRVAGIDEWERRLFDLHERSQQEGGRLIVAARDPPVSLRLRLRDLESRLAGQLVYRVVALSESQCADALLQEARRRGMEIAPATVEWLMRRVPRGADTLFSLLDRIDKVSLEENRKVTIPFLRDMGIG